ncbi:hypothetical protein BTVI_29116 [Pitangus sulphuratus]|nr:hypothetical protein BTVI_29116 [Pitangus sulphuratus]
MDHAGEAYQGLCPVGRNATENGKDSKPLPPVTVVNDYGEASCPLAVHGDHQNAERERETSAPDGKVTSQNNELERVPI